MVFVFHALATVIMLVIRLAFSKYFVLGKKSLYAALHFYPIVSFTHAIFAGIICMYSIYIIRLEF